jgi:hypothetical protein
VKPRNRFHMANQSKLNASAKDFETSLRTPNHEPIPSNRMVNCSVGFQSSGRPFPILPRFTVGATESRPTTTSCR